MSLATASVAVAIATPAAYALARFPFVGARASMRGLLATQIGVPATFTIAGFGVLGAAMLSARLPLPSWDAEPIASEPLVTPLPASVR